jgi:hypothetical protein
MRLRRTGILGAVFDALIAEVASSAIGASSGLVDSVGVLPSSDESSWFNERLLVITGLLLATAPTS